MVSARSRFIGLFVVLVLAVTATYSNHFQNAFQFDDEHTVVANAYIRDLKYVRAYFTDARTSTPNPSNQIYRPLVTLSLAIDYALGGGLVPFWFHLSTFLWFLVLLAAMAALYRRILERAGPVRPAIAPGDLALVAVAWFGLHPVMAETVNYVYQRGDLYSTLGVVATITLYAAYPPQRKRGLYLVPALLGMLAKQSALMAAPLLTLYIWLFEADEHLSVASAVASAKRALPAWILAVAYYGFQHVMTSSTWTPGGGSRLHYWLTQPIVVVHYLISSILPTELSADTDRPLVTQWLSEPVVIGVTALLGIGVLVARNLCVRERRPVAFGLLWFLLTLVPTSILPFAEVENDHRMFLPFVGLLLAIVSGLARWGTQITQESRHGVVLRRLSRLAVVLVLAGYAAGAHRRNAVWRTHESLWADVAAKSPHNGRGLLNYAVAIAARGRTAEAVDLLLRAKQYTPTYYLLYVNLGVMYGKLAQPVDAEQNFREAIRLAPDRFESYSYYAFWLGRWGRPAEALATARLAVDHNRDSLDALHALMQAMLDSNAFGDLTRLATETLARFSNDPESRRLLALARDQLAATGPDHVSEAERTAVQDPSAEHLLELSRVYELAGRHRDAIKAANLALTKQPGYVFAYHNLSVSYIALGDWPAAIAAAEHAVALDPSFEPAKQNLAWAKQQLAAQPK